MGFYVYCYQCQGCFVSDSPKTNQICPECADRNRKQCDLSVDPMAAKDFADLCRDLGYDQPTIPIPTYTPEKVRSYDSAEPIIEWTASDEGDWIPAEYGPDNAPTYGAFIEYHLASSTWDEMYQIRMREVPNGEWKHTDSII